MFFRLFDKSNFQYVEMDTDRAYMALSGPLETLAMEGRRKEFFRHYGEWFPKPYCEPTRKISSHANLMVERDGILRSVVEMFFATTLAHPGFQGV